MKIGTKTILFGVHQFLIHPIVVAIAWWKLYGFPADPRYWVVFFLHDVGYLGKPNMDGPEGEKHVELGARIVHWLFDDCHHNRAFGDVGCWKISENDLGLEHRNEHPNFERSLLWYRFTLYHSRSYAKNHGRQFSRLCVADKLAIITYPKWLYRILSHLTGEWLEYVAVANDPAGKYGTRQYSPSGSFDEWYEKLSANVRRWVAENKDKGWTGL